MNNTSACAQAVERPSPATLKPSNSWTLVGDYDEVQRVYSVTEMCKTDFYVVLRGMKCTWDSGSDMYENVFGSDRHSPKWSKFRVLCHAIVCLPEQDSYTTENVDLLARFVAEWYHVLYSDNSHSGGKFDADIDLFRFQADKTDVLHAVADIQRELQVGNDSSSGELIQRIMNLRVRNQEGGFKCKVVVCDEVHITALGGQRSEVWFLSLKPILSSDRKGADRFMDVEQTMELAMYLVTNRQSAKLKPYCVHLDALGYLILSDRIDSNTIKNNSGLKQRYTLAVALMALVFHETLLPLYNDPTKPPCKSELEVKDPHLKKLQEHSYACYQPC